MRAPSTIRTLSAVLCLSLLSACAAYQAPGRAVELERLFSGEPETPPDGARIKQPAVIAYVRVQEPQYESMTIRDGSGRHGTGLYSVLAGGELQESSHLGRLSGSSGIAAVTELPASELPRGLSGAAELLGAARRKGADLLLVYTVNTNFYEVESGEQLLVITPGMEPHHTIRISSKITAELRDVTSGARRGTLQATSELLQRGLAWQTASAIDSARLENERDALRRVGAELEAVSKRILLRP